MYLRKLRIANLKLLREFELDFTNRDGSPRMWTVFIGENGTCKTSILRAIAMTVAGARHVGELAKGPAQYCDSRCGGPAQVMAEFSIDPRLKGFRDYAGFAEGGKPEGEVRVQAMAEVTAAGALARSWYLGANVPTDVDPVDAARSDDRPLWFVAGYGVQRALPVRMDSIPQLDRPSVDRLRSLFGPSDLAGTTFANLFLPERARVYTTVLQSVLFKTRDLLPGLIDLQWSAYEDAPVAGVLPERHRFVQQCTTNNMALPATWLSHGYQSTIAWIADVVGHIVLESNMDSALAPEEMEGLVLIDEIDLYLHPAWQRVLISTLREVFPRIQFVATTHSPLSLVGLRTDLDEIVVLRADASSGDVDKVNMRGEREQEPDPRLMTGTEIYRTYFGVRELYPATVGAQLRRYRYLAADPTRSAQADMELDELQMALKANGIEVSFPRVQRIPE